MIVLDEPLSSLDASAQAQIANLLVDLARELEIGLLLISHDLAIVRQVADVVSVMYLGAIVESGPTAGALAARRSTRTREALIAAVPHADGAGVAAGRTARRGARPGTPAGGLPLPSALPVSLRSVPVEEPPLLRLDDGRTAACWLHDVDRTPLPPHAKAAGSHQPRRYSMNVLMFADTVRSPELRHEIPHTVADPFLYGEVGDSRFTVIRSLETQRMREIPNLDVVPVEDFGYDELRAEGRSSGEIELEIAARACRKFGVDAASVPPGFPLELADYLRAAGVGLTVDRELFEQRRRWKSAPEIAGIRRARLAAEAATQRSRRSCATRSSTTNGCCTRGSR